MKAQPSAKQLMKILIGVAWLDGKIQPEERKQLDKIAHKKGVADDPELRPLLYELQPVPPAKCQAWVKEYLGSRPTSEDYNQLLESISTLIYSDSDVADEEAKLLAQLQPSDSGSTEPGQFHKSAINAVQRLYRRWKSN